ncbi:tRNA glutamyl-Q(34) synthetase GluQRS [Cereibacter sphaeroides]|uniref:tRNA glutamyl-Q(34) synthetase GluQRS n=1 Tax=Cereibacter sphaeroides TaxID=1063 RepID=UPI001F1EDDA8|nr:tRNA glutamyl-Q(34) synthetase GluQRS [Cereibacter sphaeroides]MCE6961620.1 tRNA glutamyl-Q(34) synthetase GluQRS [Cereibacter sphaeroides]MCE6974970.1 tRNA glutamyl-Q(34) synthetase GluQRS [Cereibacter sphaeroides]
MAGRVTRFAPSPTGPLHLGHAFSALTVWDRAAGGTALLRIEDIDRSRCRPEWEAQIFDDLHWLGLDWPLPVMRQSERADAYRAALDRLAGMGLTYPCRCSRADIRAALSAPQEGATGPDGLIYPGTCRGRSMAEAGPEDTIRLDMAAALRLAGPLRFRETGPAREGWHEVGPLDRTAGDVVLSRRGFGTSYHLAVVVDDAAQGVTEVVRGEDLFEATAIHVLLQRLLDLPVPDFHHHRLIRDEAGKRLAKRDDARALATYRAEGRSPAEIRAMVGL